MPIKPANLKVKALLKEASIGQLKGDYDPLENHDYYFLPSDSYEKEKKKRPKAFLKRSDISDDKETLNETVDDQKHLDIYV